MSEYLIKWKIDIEADSPYEAAALARQIQLDPDSTATVFDVFDENYNCEQIDLDIDKETITFEYGQDVVEHIKNVLKQETK
mgnify:CR=1 FL=1